MIIVRLDIDHYVYNRNKDFYQIKIITMVKNYDESFEINHTKNWPYIPGHPYRILIIGHSRSGKTNVLLNLIKHSDQILVKKSTQIKLSVAY